MLKAKSYHEYANLFPLMQGAEFAELVSDIKAQGLQDDIVLYQDQILDGRNRYRACLAAKVAPRFIAYQGKQTPLDFVITHNLKRRHLNDSQRAMIAARIATLGVGKPVAGETGLTLREASASMRVSTGGIKSAKQIISSENAELIEAVDSGYIRVDAAKRILDLPKGNQSRVIKAAIVASKENQNVGTIVTNSQREVRQAELAKKGDSWNSKSKYNGPYTVIYADPPWDYDTRFGFKTDSNRRGAAKNHYEVMSVDAICNLEINGRTVSAATQDDAVLLMWVPSAFLYAGLRVCEAWGFEFFNTMVWVKKKDNKLQIGNGNWVRAAHEILFLAKRGSFPPPKTEHMPASVIEAPRTEHSSKPEEFYEIIETMFGKKQKRIELFARSMRKGWDSWGNQA